VEVAMPDNPINRAKLAQFAAQEIAMDGRIPQATGDTVLAIIEEAKNRAMKMDKMNKSLTLRLRELGGLIRTAGDIAVGQEAEYIEPKHVKQALKRSKTIEEQVNEKYGSYTRGVASDMTGAQTHSSPYHYWNQDFYDDKPGYE